MLEFQQLMNDPTLHFTRHPDTCYNTRALFFALHLSGRRIHVVLVLVYLIIVRKSHEKTKNNNKLILES